jgi:hypothetical protein
MLFDNLYNIPLFRRRSIKAPFLERQENLNDYFYLGDILLIDEYRDKAGYQLLTTVKNTMESFAQQLDYKYTTFMTIVRPDDHPLKPKDYSSLDNIWRHFGYHPHQDLTTDIDWLSSHTHTITTNKLQFWMKKLS